MSIPQTLDIEKFARYMKIIKELYSIDDDFKTLCDDYVTSKKNVEKFKHKAIEDWRVEREFEDISMELEKEILEYVKSFE